MEFMTFNFSMQAIDHIVNTAAKTLYMSAGTISCPIVFRGPNGAAAGVGAQHSQCFAAWYMSIPGLKVVAPYDAEDARGLMKAAIRDPDPVVFLENELLYGESFPVSKEALSARLRRAHRQGAGDAPGHDVTLVSLQQDGRVLQASRGGAGEGRHRAEVINLRSLRPLDRDAIAASAAKDEPRSSCVEEGWPQSGRRRGDRADGDGGRVRSPRRARRENHRRGHPDAVRREPGELALPQVRDIVRVAKRVCYK